MAELSVRVQDNLTVAENGQAECTRTFRFSNPSPQLVRLPVSVTLDLPDAVAECACTFEGDCEEPTPLELSRRPYSKTVSVPIRKMGLKAEEQHSVQVYFSWPSFFSPEDLRSEAIRLQLPFPVTYEARIEPAEEGLLGDPRVRVIPPSENLREYSVEQSGAVLVLPRLLPAESRLDLSLHGLRTTDEALPVLQYLGNAASETKPFASVVVVFIQHLLSDFLSLWSAFVRGGLEPSDAFIIGIPYSTKDDTVKSLEDFGPAAVHAPDIYPFDELAKAVLLNALARAKLKSKKILIVEDGGYLSPLFQSDPVVRSRSAACVGVVEQTRNGVWAFKESLAKDSTTYTRVLSVADSELKNRVESPLIGEAVTRNIENILGRINKTIRNKRVLLLGHGSVGAAICEELLARGCTVTVSEERDAHRPRSRGSLTAIPPGQLIEHILGQEVVIGATGATPFDSPRHFRQLRNNAILVNASSKRREFDLEVVRRMTRRSTPVPAVGRELTMVTGNRVIFLANGFPVNFFNSESVAGELMQPVLGSLFAAARYLMDTTESLDLGLLDVPESVQNEVEELCKALGDSSEG